MSILLFVSALAMAPQTAAAPVPAPAVSSEQEIGDAVKALGAATDESAAAQAEIAPLARKALASLGAPNGPGQAAAELRPLLARFKAAVDRSTAKLTAIPAVTFPKEAPFSFARIRSEIIGQNRATVGLLDAIDGLLAAAVAKDRARLQANMAKVTQGAVTLVTGQATILRGRQAAVPVDQSTHQSIGLMANLYDGMATLVGVVSDARFEGEQPPARLRRLASASRELGAAGRRNVGRELQEAERGPASERAALRTILAAENETFDLGDRMAATFAELAGAPLTKDRAREHQYRLTQYETQFHALSSRQIAAAP